MTWLSRLLPQTNRLQASALKSRARLTKQHRRMATLETLESRVVLSNVTTSLAGNVLTINLDRFNDSIKIAEVRQADGTHVTVTATDTHTNINGIPYNSGIYPSWTSPSAVGSMKVNLASGASVDHDNIELVGQGVSFLETTGAVTFTATKTSLNLSVHDIDNPGAFKLTTGGPTGGALNLDMNNVRFTSISVDQQGCCPADVSITNSFAGTVTVKEGWANGDSIYLDNDHFGATTLSQYNGAQPAAANCDGDDDTITVLNSWVRTLVINQTGDGVDNTATVDNVHLAPGLGPLGLTITQGNGEGDTATVNAVTADNGTINIRPGQELCTSIVITQGNGESDYASVSYSHVPGDILITQGDGASDEAYVSYSSAGLPGNTLCGNIIITQGAAIDTNGDPDDYTDGDTASVSISSAVLTISITQNTTTDSYPYGSAWIGYSSAGGDISITQGDGGYSSATVTYSYSGGSINIVQGLGDYDYAEVSCSTAVVDINVSQGDGNFDIVYILGVTAGHVDYVGNFPVDVDGNVTVTQGNGYADCVIVNSCDDVDTTINNLYITQGDSLPFEGCEPGLGDCVYIDDSDITSDIIITQGTAAGATAGNYLVAIGYGGPSEEYNTGPVNAGGVTSITQHGGNNTVLLGGGYGGADADEDEYTGYDFTTTYLDVFTGEDGGAYVEAVNTLVVVGSFLGNDWTIDGGGDGNTFVDLGNNVNVNANPDTFNV